MRLFRAIHSSEELKAVLLDAIEGRELKPHITLMKSERINGRLTYTEAYGKELK